MPKVAVTMVTWNSMTYLPDVLASLSAQSFRDLSVVIVDNASTDGIAEFVRERYPEVMLLRNTGNLGFARAHNQAIEYARTHLRRGGDDLFVLVTNPDVILDERHIERLVDAVSRRPEVGSAGGKLLRVRAKHDGDMREAEYTDRIDSAGIRVMRSRRTVERGSGQKDSEEFERTQEVFGVSGAVAFYRMDALEDVAYRGEYFDEDFFAYKEDIDLAWRLRLRGWTSLYVPSARAYHYRAVAAPQHRRLGDMNTSRRARYRTVNYLSCRNHLLMLLKNEHAENALRDAPRIWWYETRKMLYLMLFEPATLKAYGSALKAAPRMFGKRRLVMRRARADAADIRKWFA